MEVLKRLYNEIHCKNPEDLFKILSEVDATDLLNFKRNECDNDSVLHWILSYGNSSTHLKSICLILEKSPELLDIKNERGLIPLFSSLSSWNICYEVSTVLLKAKPSTCTTTDNNGATALHKVASKFDQAGSNQQVTEFAKLLLSFGSDINAEDNEGKSPLYYALAAISIRKRESDFFFIEFLLNNGAKLMTKSKKNPLLANLFCTHLTEYLLKIDQSLANLQDENGLVPLHYALKNSWEADEDLVEILFHYKASKNVKPNLLKHALENECSFEIIEILLRKYKFRYVNVKNRCGRTLLDEYAYSYETIKTLLDHGASAKKSHHALPKAIKECRSNILESIKLLVEAGADPTKGLTWKSYRYDNIFEILCERCVIQGGPSSLVPVVKYLCNLPQFKNKLCDASSEWQGNPEFIILEGFNSMLRKNAIKIFKEVVESKAFKPIMEVQGLLDMRCVNGTNYLFEKWFVTPIGSILNTPVLSAKLSTQTLGLLDIMLNHGFTLDQPEGRITTPLTVLLTEERVANIEVESSSEEESQSNSSEEDDEDEEEEEEKKCRRILRAKLEDQQISMAEEFIRKGVNVENMSLELFVPQGDKYDSLENDILRAEKGLDHLKNLFREGTDRAFPTEAELREEFTENVQPLVKKLWLPDALWVAFLSHNIRAVKLLLPYWSAAPLLLLIFSPRTYVSTFREWFPVLSQYGPVPHGTKECLRLSKLMEEVGEHEDGAEMLEEFQELQDSPLTLKELSRYAVRASFAEQASKPGVSLPGLLASVSPPGLKQYLLE